MKMIRDRGYVSCVKSSIVMRLISTISSLRLTENPRYGSLKMKLSMSCKNSKKIWKDFVYAILQDCGPGQIGQIGRTAQYHCYVIRHSMLSESS